MLLATGLFAARRYEGARQRQEALALVRAGRFDEAEPVLRRQLERDPGDVTAAAALAAGYLTSNRLVADAEPYLSRWCELEPDNPEPWRLRVDLWLRLRRGDEALADGRRLLELEPTNYELRKTVCWLLLGRGRFAEAEAECRRCLQSHPDDPAVRYLAADIQYLQGHSAEAAARLQPLVASTPPYLPAALLRAVLYLEARPPEPEKAVPLLRRVVAAAQDHDDRQKARYHLAQALTRLHQDEEAGEVLAAMRREQEATRLAADSRQQPGNRALHVRAAAALLQVGKSEQALPLLQGVLDADPHNGDAHAVLADYYAKLGQDERARNHRRLARGGAVP